MDDKFFTDHHNSWTEKDRNEFPVPWQRDISSWQRDISSQYLT